MDIQTKEWMRTASSGNEDIMSKLWVGDEKRAIVQIAHGMAEHIERYDDFARFLVARGFVVCMNEHAGHGAHAETLGYFAETDGAAHLVNDMKTLQDEMVKEYPYVPVFLLGHSMGSFLARKYITLYGDTLNGCILSGTSGPNSAVGFGKLLASIQKKIRGPKSEGKLLTKIAFGSYLKNIEDPINKDAWVSSDEEICTAYNEDSYCGFTFTAGGFYDLFCLLEEINKNEWFEKVPKSLPIYMFSGEEDPVGEYGKGVMLVFEKLKDAGIEDIKLQLYPGGRHEMLNEVNKDKVYEDTLNWLIIHLVKTDS